MKREALHSELHASVRQVWLAGLGVVGKVQKDSAKLFEALVEEGKKAQAQPEEAAQAPAPNTLKVLRNTLLDQVQELQERVEAQRARALHRLGVPTKEAIQALSRRVEEIQQSVQEFVAVRKPEPRKWKRI